MTFWGLLPPASQAGILFTTVSPGSASPRQGLSLYHLLRRLFLSYFKKLSLPRACHSSISARNDSVIDPSLSGIRRIPA